MNVRNGRGCVWGMTLAAGFLGFANVGATQEQETAQQQTQAQEQIYGRQLMTQQEQAAYRTQMQNAKTEAEREQIRAEHHEQMQARAKEQGVALPDDPPARGEKGQQGGDKNATGKQDRQKKATSEDPKKKSQRKKKGPPGPRRQ